MLVRIANREDHQTARIQVGQLSALQKQSDLALPCLSRPCLAGS